METYLTLSKETKRLFKVSDSIRFTFERDAEKYGRVALEVEFTKAEKSGLTGEYSYASATVDSESHRATVMDWQGNADDLWYRARIHLGSRWESETLRNVISLLPVGAKVRFLLTVNDHGRELREMDAQTYSLEMQLMKDDYDVSKRFKVASQVTRKDSSMADISVYTNHVTETVESE